MENLPTGTPLGPEPPKGIRKRAPRKKPPQPPSGTYVELNKADETTSFLKRIFDERFDEKIEGVKSKIDRKLSGLIYGVIAGTAFLFISLWVATGLFMGSYQQHYLDTQAAFTDKTEALQKENYDLKLEMNNRLQKLESQQDYIERNLIERSSK